MEPETNEPPSTIGYADPTIGETPVEQRSFRLDLLAPRNTRQLRRLGLIAAVLFGTIFGMAAINKLMSK